MKKDKKYSSLIKFWMINVHKLSCITLLIWMGWLIESLMVITLPYLHMDKLDQEKPTLLKDSHNKIKDLSHAVSSISTNQSTTNNNPTLTIAIQSQFHSYKYTTNKYST